VVRNAGFFVCRGAAATAREGLNTCTFSRKEMGTPSGSRRKGLAEHGGGQGDPVPVETDRRWPYQCGELTLNPMIDAKLFEYPNKGSVRCV
jgi:hypothetical protein